MRLGKRLLDWWGRSYHRRRMRDVEAALRKAGDRGRTKEELVADTGVSQRQVKRALGKLWEKDRVATDGVRWRTRDGARGSR